MDHFQLKLGQCCLLWTKAHFKWFEVKWNTVLGSDELKLKIIFRSPAHHFLQLNKKYHPACQQHLAEKPASLMVWGCIPVYGSGNLHIQKGNINTEGYIQVLEQRMILSWLFQENAFFFFKQDNAKRHTISIARACICSRRVWMPNWPASSPDL